MYQINMLHTLNVHSVIYQLHLNKAGRKYFKADQKKYLIKDLCLEYIKNSHNSRRTKRTHFLNKWAKDLNRHFNKENMSTGKFIRGMQIETTVRSTSHPLKWLNLKTEISSASQNVEQTVWQFLIELKQRAYNTAIPLLGIYSREMKTYVHIKTCTRVFIASLFIMAQNWKQPKCPPTDK